jgi:hypothetical protein
MLRGEHMKILYKIIPFVFLFIFIIRLSAVSAINGTEEQVRKIVEAYCQAEFNGIRDIRFELVKYSSKREAMEKKRDQQFRGKLLDWDADPLFVVSSYHIQKVTVEKNRAIAIVDYKRIAKTKGEGVPKRKLIPDYVEHDMVKLQFIHDGIKWWIFDPPLPRISIKAIINYFEDDVKQYGAQWLERTDISEEQKKTYLYSVNTLKILKELRDKSGE